MFPSTAIVVILFSPKASFINLEIEEEKKKRIVNWNIFNIIITTIDHELKLNERNSLSKNR